jgi:hypothetical protein
LFRIKILSHIYYVYKCKRKMVNGEEQGEKEGRCMMRRNGREETNAQNVDEERGSGGR